MSFNFKSPALTIGALSVLFLSGCATLTRINHQAESTDFTLTDQDKAVYFVEMHSRIGKPTIYRGEITKPTTVQEALNESGAATRYAKMSVDLYRLLPDGDHLMLPVEFQKNKQVKYEQDYALHPNDRIIIKPKTNSVLDQFVDPVFGKL